MLFLLLLLLLLLLLMLPPSGAQDMNLLVEALVEDLPDGEGLQARHGGRVCEREKKMRTF